MINDPKTFMSGFGSQFPNMSAWAQMPQMTTLPAPATPAAPPQTNPVIGGVADYNTMLPRPGGVPTTTAPTAPATGARGRVNPKGFLAAILRATNYPGFGG